MMFKVITVLCATLAIARAGLLAAPAVAYSPANEVSQVYSSIGGVAHQPLIAQATPVVAHAAAPVYHSPVVAAAAPIYSAPIAKQFTYSPAHQVHQVYNSVATPQYAYGGHGPIAFSSPAIGSTQQSTIRSLGGTISSYSKAVDTAFSSVRKADTRISNNVFTPALATKTVAIQQPAYLEQKTIPATVVSHVTFDGLGAHYAW